MPNFYENYYLHNYSTQCVKDTRFLASWQGLALGTHSLLFVTIPFYALTSFCILTKTPKTMESVKYALVNTHFWCFYSDVLICSLITPYFFFPAQCGISLGLFRWLGIPTSFQTYIGFVTTHWMSFSVVQLFENRSSSILENRFRLRGRYDRLIFYSFNIFLETVYSIPVFLNIPDFDTAVKVILTQELPCPTEEFFTSPVFVLATEPHLANYMLLSTLGIIILFYSQILFFCFCCLYYLYYCSNVTNSKNTRHSQRLFFIGMLAQLIVPFMFIIVPLVGVYYSIYSGTYNQLRNNVCVMIFCCHGLATSIVIVLVHRPYREYLLTRRREDYVVKSRTSGTECETIF